MGLCLLPAFIPPYFWDSWGLGLPSVFIYHPDVLYEHTDKHVYMTESKAQYYDQERTVTARSRLKLVHVQGFYSLIQLPSLKVQINKHRKKADGASAQFSARSVT